MESPAGQRVFRKEDHQAMYEVPWGLTKSNPTYPFKVMGSKKVVPAKECFNRPPFEGPSTTPPFTIMQSSCTYPGGPFHRHVHLAGGQRADAHLRRVEGPQLRPRHLSTCWGPTSATLSSGSRGDNFWLGLLLGPLCVCAVGFVVERWFIRYVYHRRSPISSC